MKALFKLLTFFMCEERNLSYSLSTNDYFLISAFNISTLLLKN